MGRQKKPTSPLTLLLMLLAVLGVAGFMAWLSVNSGSEEVPVVEAGEPIILDVPLVDLALDSEKFVGLDVRLTNIEVSSLMGGGVFWTIAENGSPFLVKPSDDLVAAGIGAEKGEAVTVAGEVRAMSTEVLDAWERIGIIRSAAERSITEYATAYLEASELISDRSQVTEFKQH